MQPGNLIPAFSSSCSLLGKFILFLSFLHVEGMIAMTAISLLKALRLLPWLVEPDKHDQDHLEPLR